MSRRFLQLLIAVLVIYCVFMTWLAWRNGEIADRALGIVHKADVECVHVPYSLGARPKCVIA